MVHYTFVAFAGMAVALPLNINLGAYSPALVVGDGEISFGGEQDVSNLMNVLEGAAVNAAAGVAGGAGVEAGAGAGAGGENAGGAGTPPPPPPPNTEAASNAAVVTPDDAVLQQQAQQISAMQGLGSKEIAPREDETAEAAPAKRDLSGFDRALTYAEAALTKGPVVELGTGKEGSGVGILVDNTPGGVVAAAAAGEARPAAPATAAGKRDLASDEAEAAPKRVRAKVTTMYVRSGVPKALRMRDETNGAPAVRAVPVKRAVSSDLLDSVNLNVAGDQGVTMTFVETVDEEEEA